TGGLRPDVDFPEPRDVDHTFDVEDGHFSIPPECRRPRWGIFRNAIVKKLIMDTLAGYQRPHEEELRHARIGFDIMSKDVLNCFIPADFQSARPGALNGHLWRRDHKEHVDEISKAGQQTP